MKPRNSEKVHQLGFLETRVALDYLKAIKNLNHRARDVVKTGRLLKQGNYWSRVKLWKTGLSTYMNFIGP